MNYNRWYKLAAGDYVMTTWCGESQLTYRAARRDGGWTLTRKVAGAGTADIARALKTLREAKIVAECDARLGL